MRTILTIVVIVISCLDVSADISLHYYYLVGTAKYGKNEVYKNTELYIIQGDFKKIVRTDNEGKYKIKVRYLKPCLSGGNYEYTDLKMLNFAKQYNGNELKIYLPSKSIVLSERITWMDYYLKQKKDSEITVLDFNFQKASKVMSSDKNIEIYKETNHDIEVVYHRMATREISTIYDCHRQNEDLRFIINRIDFSRQPLEYFLDKLSIKRSDMKIIKSRKSSIRYQVCNMFSTELMLEIKLSNDDIIEEIRMPYGS